METNQLAPASRLNHQQPSIVALALRFAYPDADDAVVTGATRRRNRGRRAESGSSEFHGTLSPEGADDAVYFQTFCCSFIPPA